MTRFFEFPDSIPDDYNAVAVRVLRAVQRWAAAHSGVSPTWRGLALDRRVAIAADLGDASRYYAADPDARELGDAVCVAVPGSTWLMFAAALDQVYPNWRSVAPRGAS